MAKTRTALIIGGGIAGPVAAMALRKAGIEATVYEAYPPAAEGLGGSLRAHAKFSRLGDEKKIASAERISDLARAVHDAGAFHRARECPASRHPRRCFR